MVSIVLSILYRENKAVVDMKKIVFTLTATMT